MGIALIVRPFPGFGLGFPDRMSPMRGLCFVFLPILLLAQSSAPPGKSVAADNAVTTANGARDRRPKTGTGAPESPSDSTTAQGHSYSTTQTAQLSPSKKPPQVDPDPIVTYTFLLVIVGALQFVALIVQAVFLCLAFKETTKATGLTAQALTETQRANAANETLTTQSNETTQAAVTEAQRSNAESERLTGESLTETRNATALTKDSIILTHRPRLVVRGFYAHAGMTAFKEGSTVDGAFEISNIGGTGAKVTEIHATVMMLGVLPMKRPYEGIDNQWRSGSKYLNAGESMQATFRKDDGILQQGDVSEIVGPSTNSRFLYVLGFVRYHDDSDPPIPRRTVFCRRFDRRTGRFTPVADEDYENAD